MTTDKEVLMNILPLLLGFIAWQFFSGKNKKPPEKEDANPFKYFGGGLLNDLINNPEALAALAQVTTLFDKGADEAEKSAAIFSLLSNPAVFEIAKGFFNSYNSAKSKREREPDRRKTRSEQPSPPAPEPQPQSPSKEAREIFEPVSTIAGVKISEKLCHLYDNWYIKK